MRPIHILFLSQFAETNEQDFPVLREKYGSKPSYHLNISQILNKLGYKVTLTSDLEYLFKKPNNFDFVYSLFHRANFKNSEIFVPSVCEYIKKPYLGSGPNIRAIAEDKHLTKLLANSLGIKTPDWIVLRSNITRLSAYQQPFAPPFFVKPRFGAASDLINENSLHYEWESAIKHANTILDNSIDLIIEKFIPGKNACISFVGGSKPIILPAIIYETESLHSIESNLLKRGFIKNGYREFIASEIGLNDIQNHLRKSAEKLLEVLPEIDYGRLDFRFESENAIPEFLEFNICCSLSKGSHTVKASKAIGLNQSDLIKKILDVSFIRQKLIGQTL